MTEEVRLLEELGAKPDYNKLGEKEKQFIDQTASGELTPGALDKAFSRLDNPVSVILPPRHQTAIRRDELFVQYTEEKILNGVIGRYMGAIVIVDENLHQPGKVRALVTCGETDKYAEILLF